MCTIGYRIDITKCMVGYLNLYEGKVKVIGIFQSMFEWQI